MYASRSILNVSFCHQCFEATNTIFEYIYVFTEKYVMWYSEILYQHSEHRKTPKQTTVSASKNLYSNLPVRLSLRPPKSIHFGDVSQTNGRRTRFFARSLFQAFS